MNIKKYFQERKIIRASEEAKKLEMEIDGANNNYKKWVILKKNKGSEDLLYPYKNEVVAVPGRDVMGIIMIVMGLFVVGRWGVSVVQGWIEPQSKNPIWQATQTAIHNKDVVKVDYSGIVKPGGDDREPEVTERPMQVEIIVPTSVPEVYVTKEVINYKNIVYPGSVVLAKFSNYYPPRGGINCHNDNCDLLADGTMVVDVIKNNWRVCACPEPFQFGTLFEFPPGSGVLYECRDRGGMVVYGEDRTWFWLDFFEDISFVDYGTFIQVKVVEREEAIYYGWQVQQ